MAEQTFPGAPTVGRDTGSSILKAHVIDVNMKRYTASVATEAAGRKYFDLAIGVPYAHSEKGEGFYVIPDIGAQCWIGTDGGGGPPVILCFAPLPKAISTSEQNNSEAQPQEGDEVLTDYGAKRPQRLPGEFGLTSRDGAFLHYLKGGIVEIGSNPACQRLFIPLGNHIRDVCEDFGSLTAGGVHYFRTDRTEGDDGADSNALWQVLVKDKGVDTKATVLMEMGHTPADKRLRIVIAPRIIKFQDGAYDEASAVYHLYIDEDGNVDEKASEVVRSYSKLTVNVTGDVDETVGGSSVETVTGSKKVTARDILLAVTAGIITLSGNTTLIGTLTCTVDMGLGAALPSLLAFLGVYNTHTHAVTIPGPPPVVLTTTTPLPIYP